MNHSRFSDYLAASILAAGILSLTDCTQMWGESDDPGVAGTGLTKTGFGAATGAVIGGGLGAIIGAESGATGGGLVLGSLAGAAAG